MRIRCLVAAAVATFCSCLLEPAAGPGYPSVFEDSFQTDSLGEPSSCTFSTDGAFWACTCEGGLILAEIGGAESVFETTEEVADAAFFAGTSEVLAAGGDSVFGVQPGGLTGRAGLESPAYLVEPLSTGVLAIHADGSLTRIQPDLSIGAAVETAVEEPICACILPGGSLVFVGDSTGIHGIDPSSGGTSVSIATSGAVIDLFDAGDGNLGAAVEGGNELWVLDPETLSIVILYTFPAYPVVGAATPDGLFCYGGCSGDQGLIVVSSSGEQVQNSPSYGTISDIAVSPDSLRAIVASRTGMSLTVLGF